MSIEKSNFINYFSQLALDNRISLFLGAGSSCDAGYPTWASLFKPMAKELGIEINEMTDYYNLAQYYTNKFGLPELKKQINLEIDKDSESQLLNELLNIEFSNVWTTNYDNLIENNFSKRKILVNKIYQDADLPNIDLNKKINIFKMNGDISNPTGIIATRQEYENYQGLHHLMLMFFKRELICSTFLFIGYSFTDGLVLNCISELTRFIGDSTTHHYTIMKNDKENSSFKYFVYDLEKRYHIHTLLVDDYAEIPQILSDINRRIQSKKVFISGAFKSYDNKLSEFSHQLAKKLSNALLENDYRIINGIGSRFGTHLIGYSNEYLVKHGVKNTEKHLIIKPFVGNDENSEEEKNQLRYDVISKCGAAIYVFGDIPPSGCISGVMEEFNIARQQHKVIIPIPYPGMISEKIWNEVKNNITEFPYLEGVMDSLKEINSVDKIVKTIIYILDSTRESL